MNKSIIIKIEYGTKPHSKTPDIDSDLIEWLLSENFKLNYINVEQIEGGLYE